MKLTHLPVSACHRPTDTAEFIGFSLANPCEKNEWRQCPQTKALINALRWHYLNGNLFPSHPPYFPILPAADISAPKGAIWPISRSTPSPAGSHSAASSRPPVRNDTAGLEGHSARAPSPQVTRPSPPAGSRGEARGGKGSGGPPAAAPRSEVKLWRRHLGRSRRAGGRNNARRPGPGSGGPALPAPPPPCPQTTSAAGPPPPAAAALTKGGAGLPAAGAGGERSGSGSGPARPAERGPGQPAPPAGAAPAGRRRSGPTFLSSFSVPCLRSGWPLSAAGAGSAGCPSRWCGRWCGQPPDPAAGGMGSGHGETPLTSISIFQFTVLRDKSRQTLSTTPRLSSAILSPSFLFSFFLSLFCFFLLPPFLPFPPSGGRDTHGSGRGCCTDPAAAILP